MPVIGGWASCVVEVDVEVACVVVVLVVVLFDTGAEIRVMANVGLVFPELPITIGIC